MEAERIREYVKGEDSHLTELVFTIISKIEQEEKRKRKQIQAQGIAAAKARGVRFGAPPSNTLLSNTKPMSLKHPVIKQ